MASSYFTFDAHSSSSGSFVPYGDSTYDDGVDFGEDNSPQNDDPDDTVSNKKPTPKRRRVTRACDECRRKKIRCDGKQPCSHCSVFGYECTYDLPTNRRRNATPQYTEFLEGQLKSAIKLLQLVFPAMDFKTPGMLDHLRNRLQAQLSTQVSQPPTMTTSLRNMGIPDMDSAESLPTTTQQQPPEKVESALDMHDTVTWEVSNQFADLNFTNKLWSCRNMHPNCPNPTSSPPTSLEYPAEFHESRSPSLTSKNSYATPTRKRHSLHHMATSTNAGPANFNINAANNIHQSFMFPPASVGISSPSSSVTQTQPINTSTMIFPSANAPIYPNHSVTMFENGETPTNGQEKEAQFIENIPQRRHSTNTMAFPGTSALNEIYHESARQPTGYGVQFYEAVPKTEISDDRMQRCVPFGASNASQPLHPASAQYSNPADQQAWSRALFNSRMNIGNTGLAGRNG